MTPSIRVSFACGPRVGAANGPNAGRADASQPWRIYRGQQLAHDDGHFRCEVNLPHGAASLAVSGSRTVMLAGSAAKSHGNVDDAAGRLGDAIAQDPVAALVHLQGPFIVLYADNERGTLLFATDRVATRSPCYAIDADRICLGLTAADVAAVRGRPAELRPQAIYDYLYFHVIPAPETIFSGVMRLLPGECLRVDDGHARVESWWTPDYDIGYRPSDLPAAKSEFRALLRGAVAARFDGVPTGAFLSGGTDSSTVAGMLGLVSGSPARTYSIGFDVDGYDEIGYARIAAKHFGTRHHEYYLTPDDLVASIPQVAASYDQPFGNSSVIPAYYCAQLAASDGIEKLLGGDGGDELFGGNTRYARQKLFEAYTVAPAWITRRLVEPLLLGVSAVERVPLLRKARSYVQQANVAMPARMHTYNLIDRIGRESIFEGAFLDAIDAEDPARQQTSFYARCADDSVVNRMLHYDWKFTLSDNDLPKVTGACDLAGLDVGFPLLDDRIVDFANRLPASWKVRGLRLRYFFKSALADFLPRAIITKKKHGFGLPFGQWLVRHDGLRAITTGSLESLRDRGIVRAAFFDELLQRVATEHAGFYGELVWILLMLEQWLSVHEPEYRFGI